MQSTTPGKLVALTAEPRTAKEIMRLASPRFQVISSRAATSALAMAQTQLGVEVLVAEYVTPSEDGAKTAAAPGAVALLEAARIRCPHVHRVLLAPADQLPFLISVLHSGTANVLVALPIEPGEFAAAIVPPRLEAEIPVGLLHDVEAMALPASPGRI